MSIHLIAAVAKNSVIGYQGAIPWKIQEDLQHFKELTMGQTVIMGRKTFKSIGRPLPGRQNIVVTSTIDFIEGCQIARSLEEAIELAERDEVFIIGGAMLYAEAMPMAQILDLTLVDIEPEGDTCFPAIEWNAYEETEREPHKGNPAYTYVTLRKK